MLQHSSVMYTGNISVVDVVLFSVTMISVCMELCLEHGKLDLMGIYECNLCVFCITELFL